MSRKRRLTEAATTAPTAPRPGRSVQWAASRGSVAGRVVSVHKTGKVPGVPMLVEASAEQPVARVQLYAKVGKAYEPTTTYIAQPTSALTVVDDLPLVQADEQLDDAAPDEILEPVAEAVLTGSFDDVRCSVRDAIVAMLSGLGMPEPDVYVLDIGVTWCVYQVGWHSDLWMVSYALGADGMPEIGQPQRVYRQTGYVTEDGATESVRLDSGRVLAAVGANEDGGRIYRVMIVRYGQSRNGRLYPEQVMREAAPLYEGAKAYDHHRTETEIATSTIAGLVGTFRNVEATDEGIEADLHLLPSATATAEALDLSLANQTDGLPPLVGISHDVVTMHKTTTVAGRTVLEATRIVRVNSADVVADPAAGGQAMRMVAALGDQITNPDRKGPRMNFQQLLALLRTIEADQRAELLRNNTDVYSPMGLTSEQVLRLAESDPAPPPAGATTLTEATVPSFVRGSLLTRQLVEAAVRAAKLDDRFVEAVIAELPETGVTESTITERVAAVRRIAEGMERAGLAPQVPETQTSVTADERDKKIAALDNMLAGNFREGYRSLKAAFVDITGYQPRALDTEDLARRVLRESLVVNVGGHRETYDSEAVRSARATESLDTTSWGEILGDSITRRMVAMYGLPQLQTWRPLVSSIVPIADFRTQRLDRVGGYGTLPAVAQGAPYQPLTSPTDEEVTYAISKRGGTEDLTIETIANDDLRAVQRIPTALGRAAAQTLYRFVFDFLDTNPTIYDSQTLFVAGHNNTATNALSGANLSAARKAMRKQTAYGDSVELLSFVPKFLVTVADLEELAFELSTSSVAMPSGAPVGAASDLPNLHQGIVPIIVDYWSSTTKWITVADPSMVPTMELGFYGGREEPELFVQSDTANGSMFTADKITYKVRHIYGGAIVDFRGFYRGNT